MASRDFLKHVVSTSEPVGSTLGDEYYNPSSNKLFKRLAVNGTSVQWVERQQSIAVQSSGVTVATGARTINFPGATIGYDSVTDTITIQSSGIPGGANTNIQFNNSGAFAGSGNLTWNNGTQTLALTGFLTTFALSRSGNINAPTWTTTSPVFNSAAALLTDTTGSGTIALKVGHSFLSPNFASSSSTTITDAVNLYVNANVASTNTTITNNWALYVAGNQRVTGTLFADNQITGSISGTAANVTGVVAVANGGTGSGVIATARTNLGATTLGANLFTLANVAAISFPRINADNTVSSLNAADFRTAIGVGTGSGTVTSVSVTSANGFAGTVATSTTTPAITISTSITGILKGNATAISAAVAGTDYLVPPTGTALLKANSGGALANAVAGTDYQTAQSVTGIVKSTGTTRSAAVAGTDFMAPSSSFNLGTTSITLNRASAAQSLTGINIDGSAGSAASSTFTRALQQTDGTSFLTPVDPRGASGSRTTILNANQYSYGLFSEFKNSSAFSFTGTYTGLITYANYAGTTASTGDPTYQLAFHPNSANATANPRLKFRAGIDTTWGAWGEVSHTGVPDLNIAHNSVGIGVSAGGTAGFLSVSYQAAINTTTPGTTRYGIHLQGQTTGDQANGITWNGGTGTTGAQAGIYVQGSGSYGTKMYIATTDSYATGSITAISIDHVGAVQIARNNLTVNLGYMIQSTATGLTAAGTTQGTALQLARQINDVTVVTAGTNFGVRLPAATAGMRIIVRNSSAVNLSVYPNTGAQIQSLGTNVAMVLVAATMLEYVAVSATQWYLMNNVYA
jgi:hypothetical protein